MLDAAVVAARLAQLACAMPLLGAPLFFLYGLPPGGASAAATLKWPRPLLLTAALIILAGSGASLMAQTAVMTGDAADAFHAGSVADVLTDTRFGLAIMARAALAVLAALALLAIRPSRVLWLALGLLAAGIVATFAWTGHGASDEGTAGVIHLVSDILHLLAAAVWLGALACLTILLFTVREEAPGGASVLHDALAGFSGLGSAVVATLLATGLANSWFLVGLPHLSDLLRTPYGLLLSAKLALFTAMLVMAAANRFRLTPQLARALDVPGETTRAIAGLRRSIVLESAAACMIIGLVAVLGTLAPPSSA